jgi:hypothetical protein
MSDVKRTLSHPEFQGLIGVARRDATPPAGMYARNWGSSTHDVAEGVHRPLYASCLVFRDESARTELIFVTLDVMIFWQDEAIRLREAILSRLKLQPHQLMIHPSHTHSGPVLLRKHAQRPGGHLIEPYLDSLPTLFCDLIAEARAHCRPAILGWAYGKCALAVNRDAVDPASGRDVCGLNPAAAADDTVLVGRISDSQGEITATIVNYACHPVSLGGANRLLSPDYVGSLREVVEQEAGGICVFFHGASGDTTPRRSYEADVAVADQNGRELGHAALATLNSMFPPGRDLEYAGIEESGTALGLWRLQSKPQVSRHLHGERISMTLPVRDMPTRQQIERAMAAGPSRFELERLERAMDRRAIVGDAATTDFYFTVWRLGAAFILATPAEPYCSFQIRLRAQFPDTTVAVLNATDGCLNYLPEPETFARDVYQVRVALYEKGSLEAVLERASEAIEQLA